MINAGGRACEGQSKRWVLDWLHPVTSSNTFYAPVSIAHKRQRASTLVCLPYAHGGRAEIVATEVRLIFYSKLLAENSILFIDCVCSEFSTKSHFGWNDLRVNSFGRRVERVGQSKWLDFRWTLSIGNGIQLKYSLGITMASNEATPFSSWQKQFFPLLICKSFATSSTKWGLSTPNWTCVCIYVCLRNIVRQHNSLYCVCVLWWCLGGVWVVCGVDVYTTTLHSHLHAAQPLRVRCVFRAVG